MKIQKLALTTLTVIVFALAGCSNEEGKKEQQEQKQQEQQKSDKTETTSYSVKEGVDYKIIAGKTASEEPLVYEFFSYTCPHCYNLDPVMQKWKKDIKPEAITFQQIPVFMQQVAHLTYGFYAAQELGVLEQVHSSIFSEWHEKENIIRTKEDLIPIFEKAGVSAEKFEQTYNSAEVEAKVEKAKQMMAEFQVTSFPLVIVNEKYEVTSYKNLDELLGKFALGHTE